MFLQISAKVWLFSSKRQVYPSAITHLLFALSIHCFELGHFNLNAFETCRANWNEKDMISYHHVCVSEIFSLFQMIERCFFFKVYVVESPCRKPSRTCSSLLFVYLSRNLFVLWILTILIAAFWIKHLNSFLNYWLKP